MKTAVASLKLNARELGIALFLVILLELAFYASRSDSLSAFIFVKSVGEVFLAPLYPGIFLLYPPFLIMLLSVALVYSCRLTRRWVRIPLFIWLLFLWVALGLFTIIQWYH